MTTLRTTATALFCLVQLASCSHNLPGDATEEMAYSAEWQSLMRHETPEWFQDAKFGIFIHWGPYSVPAWGPQGTYAEWYPRYMYQDGETSRYHAEAYGAPPEFGYKNFIASFRAENWDPAEWAELFASSGAKLVVPVAEHHDGFAMWDSELTEWDSVDKGPGRDIIGDLETEIRAHGMRYAPSYHRERHFSYFRQHNQGWKGETDWPWGVDPDTLPFSGVAAEIAAAPDAEGLYGPFRLDEAFIADYVARWKEIETKYNPDMMWLDDIPVLYTSPEAPIVSSFQAALAQMIADYLNTAEAQGREVAVNNKGINANFPHAFGLREADYLVSRDIRERPWIASRGIGRSYGLNMQEEHKTGGIDAYASSEELIETLIDVVSKNGFFLLNVGPSADGTISEQQSQRLLDIGRWLESNGESIFGTRPWYLSQDENIRYTRKGTDLYLICLEWPGDVLQIPYGDEVVTPDLEISLIGKTEALPFRERYTGAVEVDLSNLSHIPQDKPSAAYVFKLTGAAVDRLDKREF